MNSVLHEPKLIYARRTEPFKTLINEPTQAANQIPMEFANTLAAILDPLEAVLHQ